MKVYTKTGDQGQTSLVGGTRVSKAEPRIEAYGHVDELNSVIGLIRAEIVDLEALHELSQMLEDCQHQLFNLGSHLACEKDDFRSHLPALSEEFVEKLEEQIDDFTTSLPKLKEFILPGGHKAAAQLHIARTVARRAERATVLAQENSPLSPLIITTLNRLSDYFFTAARWCNMKMNVADVVWKKTK